MYYKELKAPALIKLGRDILKNIDWILKDAHFYYSNKILITQEWLFEEYKEQLNVSEFSEILFVKGGEAAEAIELAGKINGLDALLFGFGGGSVIDQVKYIGERCDIPFITIPTTLSNDSLCSAVARLISGGRKRSYAVQPPLGILVDFGVVARSPKKLTLAGVADVISNHSAVKDWILAHKNTGESIDDLALMLAKNAPEPLYMYKAADLESDAFFYDLASGLILSGMSMIMTGNSRGASGSEHLISHAIDEYFPEKSTIHGLQVGWAHLMIEKYCRKDLDEYEKIRRFFDAIGLTEVIDECVPWTEEEFQSLIPYAKTIRKRYTIFDTM